MTTRVDALLLLSSYQKSEEEGKRLDHNDKETATIGQPGMQGGPTAVVAVFIVQQGQSQRGEGSNNNNYDDNNGGGNNGERGAAAQLKATMLMEMSTTTKLTKMTMMVMGRNVYIVRGGGGQGCTCCHPQGS